VNCTELPELKHRFSQGKEIEMTVPTVTADREQLFATLADPATTGQFFERVSDEVSWTVEGTHPLAGTYTSKRSFVDSTFTVLDPLMRDGLRLEVRNLHVAGDYAIAELQAIATTTEGVPFDNRYCWVCRFDGDLIVEVRAYLDSAMVAYAIGRADALSRK
jgi:ketosteroid isomerase-like protein